MHAIGRRSRTALAVAGAAVGCAAFATLPLAARSAANVATPSRSITALQARLESIDEVRVALPHMEDPFERPLPDATAAQPMLPARPAEMRALPFSPGLPVLPPNAGADGAVPSVPGTPPFAVSSPVSVTLNALALGPPSYALVTEGGSTRVVAQGDRLAQSTVSVLDADGIHLADGRTFRLRAGP